MPENAFSSIPGMKEAQQQYKVFSEDAGRDLNMWMTQSLDPANIGWTIVYVCSFFAFFAWLTLACVSLNRARSNGDSEWSGDEADEDEGKKELQVCAKKKSSKKGR